MFRCKLPTLQSVLTTLRREMNFHAQPTLTFKSTQQESQIKNFDLQKFEGKYILSFTIRESRFKYEHFKSLALKNPNVTYLSTWREFQSAISIETVDFDQLLNLLDVAKQIEDLDPNFEKLIHDFTTEESKYRSDPHTDNSDTIFDPTRHRRESIYKNSYFGQMFQPNPQSYGDQEIMDVICGEDPGWRNGI